MTKNTKSYMRTATPVSQLKPARNIPEPDWTQGVMSSSTYMRSETPESQLVPARDIPKPDWSKRVGDNPSSAQASSRASKRPKLSSKKAKNEVKPAKDALDKVDSHAVKEESSAAENDGPQASTSASLSTAKPKRAKKSKSRPGSGLLGARPPIQYSEQQIADGLKWAERMKERAIDLDEEL